MKTFKDIKKEATTNLVITPFFNEHFKKGTMLMKNKNHLFNSPLIL